MAHDPTAVPDAVRLSLVESYRRDLSHLWGIQPLPSGDDVDALLSPADRASLKERRKTLTRSNDTGNHADFYRWTARARRFGAVHSLRWMELLAGGIWAAQLLERLGVRGGIADVGCGAGAWTTWMTTFQQTKVCGFDVVAEQIAFGRRTLTQHGRRALLRVADVAALPETPRFAAIVSLQGLGLFFHRREFGVLQRVASALLPDGYLLLVDELPGRRRDYTPAFRKAGLALLGVGMVGGMGIDAVWKSYDGLVLRKCPHTAVPSTKQTRETVEGLWRRFSAYATGPLPDWTWCNTAYWWAHGGDSWQSVTPLAAP